MPITYNNTTKVITAQFVSGDTKGNSLANAWVVDDFYQAITDAGYPDDWKKQGSSHLLNGVSITITGTGTYVHFYNSTIEWIGAPTHCIRVYSPAYFQVSRDDMSQTNIQGGCAFIVNTSAAKLFYLAGYCKIFNSLFSSPIYNRFTIAATGNADDPWLMERCTIINATYTVSSAGITGYSPVNVIFRNNTTINSEYGISYFGIVGIYKEISWVTVIGNLAMFVASNRVTPTYHRMINIKSPLSVIAPRAYYDAVGGLNIIDSLIGTVNPKATILTAGYVGAKAFVDSYSTFSFYVENGEGATIKVYDKNDVLLLDDVLLTDGELTGKELKYWERSQEKTQDNPNVYVNVNERYDPFRLIITKTGYQDLIIENINIVDGEPTNIFANMIFPELQISAVEITDTSAIGASDGTLTITAEGGDGTYQYSINGTDYQAGNEFTGLPAELYTLYAKDGEDVIATFDVEINDPIYKNVYIDRTVSGAISATQINDSVQLTKQIGGRVSVNTSAQVSGTVQKTKSISGTVEKKVAGTIQPTKQISGTITVKTL